jgi:integrase
MRRAQYAWAFKTPKRKQEDLPEEAEPPKDLADTVRWLEKHTIPVSALGDLTIIKRALAALGLKQDGTKAAASTVARKRAVFHNFLEYAVELKCLKANPVQEAKKSKRAPKTVETVDPEVLPDRRRAEALLAAVGNLPNSGKRLKAFYGCIYYAAMRPGEVSELREDNYFPPKRSGEWGKFHLRKSAPAVAADWSDSGTRRESRQLKHRADKDLRVVPCHPRLAELLKEHICQYGVAPDGRLFRGARGGPVPDSVTSAAWKAARKAALTKKEAASGLAGRPYDLRHACVTSWLNAGVDAAQVAEWAGHSVGVLMRVYVRCVVGRDEVARRRIEDAFKADEEGSGNSQDDGPDPTDEPD